MNFRPSTAENVKISSSLALHYITIGTFAFAQYRMTSDCSGEKNSAFVFIKPHANTTAAQSLVQSTLQARGITIKSEGELTAAQIDKGINFNTCIPILLLAV